MSDTVVAMLVVGGELLGMFVGAGIMFYARRTHERSRKVSEFE